MRGGIFLHHHQVETVADCLRRGSNPERGRGERTGGDFTQDEVEEATHAVLVIQGARLRRCSALWCNLGALTMDANVLIVAKESGFHHHQRDRR